MSPNDLQYPLAEHIRRLRPYVPGKPIEEVQRELGLTDVVKLASNENPLGPSPRVAEALRSAAEKLAFYPDAACHDLVDALCRRHGARQEQVVVGNGSDELIHYLGLAFLQPGDQLLTGDPSFVRYEAAAVLNRAEYVAVPLREHRFDLPAMAARVTPATRLVFIANPNNPTGTIVLRDELERFLDNLPATCVVVLDEAYHEYVEEPDYPDSWRYVEQGRPVVILRTFSKIFALASLRVGYAVGRADLIYALHQVREPFNVNGFGQAAALASLADPEQVSRSREANARGRDFLYQQFEKLGLEYVHTHANFVLVNVGEPAGPVYEALLRRGVIVRAGEPLGIPGYLRVTIGRPEDNRRFAEALPEALAACGRAVPALVGTA